MDQLPPGDICPHAFDDASFRTPRHNDTVCQKECAYCCLTASHPGGIFCCAKCFIGVCPAHVDKHLALCADHMTYVRLQTVTEYPDEAPVITDHSQIGAATPKTTTQTCYCGECGVHYSAASMECAAAQAGTAIENADAPANDAGDAAAMAWGFDAPCAHCNASLQQEAHAVFHSGAGGRGPTARERCSSCDCAQNCWMCMTCGAIGCPRAEAGGQQHAIAHFEQTGHPLVLKLGTVTPARADLHCYGCDAEIGFYDELNNHLRHFGIDMANSVKTAKSLAEMELDQSQKHEYDSVTEEGAALVPEFGPSRTGLNNFGNTCYIASVLQALAVTRPFVEKVCGDARVQITGARVAGGGAAASAAVTTGGEHHIASCTNPNPLSCVQCQAERLFGDMLSGRFSIAPPPSDAGDAAAENFRARRTREDLNGIEPRLWKKLLAGNHNDFKGSEQQDADDYFWFIMESLRSVMPPPETSPLNPSSSEPVERAGAAAAANAGGGAAAAAAASTDGACNVGALQAMMEARGAATGVSTCNAGQLFEFLDERRRQCNRCNTVRYDFFRQHSLRMRLPVDPPAPVDPGVKLTPEQLEARRVPCSWQQMSDAFLAPDVTEGVTCPNCSETCTMTETHRMATFPEFVCIKAIREYWDRARLQVSKLDAKVEIPQELELSAFVGTGFQAGSERWMSQDPRIAAEEAAAAAGPAGGGGGAGAGGSEGPAPDADMLAMLLGMGMELDKSRWALHKTFNNVDAAVGYIFSNDDEPTAAQLEQLAAVEAAAAGGGGSGGSDGDAAGGAARDAPQYAAKNTVGTDGAPAGYKLYAIVTHMGQNATMGHWVAHVFHPHLNCWLIYNDGKVARSLSPPFTRGSLYFYRRS